EECSIFDDRPADHSAEVVDSFCRLGLLEQICKPVVRIQHIVPKIFKQSTVEPVRTRARYDRDLGPWSSPELWSVSRGLDSELLQCIFGDKVVGTARNAESWRCPAGALGKHAKWKNADVRTYAIY